MHAQRKWLSMTVSYRMYKYTTISSWMWWIEQLSIMTTELGLLPLKGLICGISVFLRKSKVCPSTIPTTIYGNDSVWCKCGNGIDSLPPYMQTMWYWSGTSDCIAKSTNVIFWIGACLIQLFSWKQRTLSHKCSLEHIGSLQCNLFNFFMGQAEEVYRWLPEKLRGR